MTEIVAADIGGTHARFVIATIEYGRVAALGQPVTLKTADHENLYAAWERFEKIAKNPIPRVAAIAIASPVGGDVIRFTNNPWIVRPAQLAGELGLDCHLLVNDFGAVGHAVAQLGPEHFRHLCGPDRPLPESGTISVIGPGTGLGVAHILRRDGGYVVNESEGGHIAFAPLDETEDAILSYLRKRHGRVSAERVVSGPALRAIHEALGGPAIEERALWALALDDAGSLAGAALDRFCLSLGAVAGDIALAQGASGVVIAGGLGLRIADRLAASGFAERFVAKGRFEGMMAGIPVKLITHPEPGLYGAAAAFAASAQ